MNTPDTPSSHLPAGLSVPSYDLNHPMRVIAANEVHSRPFVEISAPAEISHLALFADPAQGQNHTWLVSLCQHFGLTQPDASALHFIHDFGDFQLKWQNHTEFASYTLYRSVADGEPFSDPPHRYLPQSWLQQLGGAVMVAAHIHVGKASAQEANEMPKRHFPSHAVAGSRVVGRRGEVWSDFRIQADGYSRFLVIDQGLTNMQTGRLAQRIAEIETYRTLALLALPIAYKSQPDLRSCDEQLAEITLALERTGSQEQEQQLMQRLITLAARIEAMIQFSAYRFGAARAYWKIVEARMADLREERIEGSPTIAEFMERRLAPAIEFCQSVSDRHQNLAERVARASDMLRTRVSITQEQQNSAILASLNRRSEVQLRLQQAVEGFSTVAITYYLIGLIGYVAKGLKALGLDVNPDLASTLSIPLVFAAVWIGVRRLRHSLAGKES